MKRIALLLLVCMLLNTACAAKQTQSLAAASASTPAPTPTLEQLLDDALRLMNEGRYEEAILAYEGVLQIEPRNKAALLGVSKLYQKAGRVQEGIRALEAALAYYPEDADIRAAYAAAEMLKPTPMETPSHVPQEPEDYLLDGICTFYSADSDMVINLSGKTDEATDKDGTKVILWSSTDSNMQRFRIEAVGGNACRLYALSSGGGNGRVLQAGSRTGAVPQEGNPILLWETNNDISQLWIIERQKDGYYIIRLAKQPELVMTCEDGKKGSVLTLQPYIGNASQCWQRKQITDAPEPEALLEAIIQSPSAQLLGKTYTELNEKYGPVQWADFIPDGEDQFGFERLHGTATYFGYDSIPWEMLDEEGYNSGYAKVDGPKADKYVDPTRQCTMVGFGVDHIFSLPPEGLEAVWLSTGELGEGDGGYYYFVHYQGFKIEFNVNERGRILYEGSRIILALGV